MAASERLLRLLRTRDADFDAAFRALEQRRQLGAEEVGRAVSVIVDDVRRRGDDALLDATERFDGYRLAPAWFQALSGDAAIVVDDQ